MNKNELEFQRLQIRSENFRNFLQLIKHAITAATILGCVYVIFWSLKEIVTAKPESVNALALLAEKLQVKDIIGYLAGIGMGGAWFFERQGKKRLVKRLGAQRKETEANDSYRGSSGLTDTGDTPSQ